MVICTGWSQHRGSATDACDCNTGNKGVALLQVLRALMGRAVVSEAREEDMFNMFDRVIAYYGAEDPDRPGRVLCCVTVRYVDKHLVMGAHILPVPSQVGSLLVSWSSVFCKTLTPKS